MCLCEFGCVCVCTSYHLILLSSKFCYLINATYLSIPEVKGYRPPPVVSLSLLRSPCRLRGLRVSIRPYSFQLPSPSPSLECGETLGSGSGVEWEWGGAVRSEDGIHIAAHTVKCLHRKLFSK